MKKLTAWLGIECGVDCYFEIDCASGGFGTGCPETTRISRNKAIDGDEQMPKMIVTLREAIKIMLSKGIIKGKYNTEEKSFVGVINIDGLNGAESHFLQNIIQLAGLTGKISEKPARDSLYDILGQFQNPELEITDNMIDSHIQNTVTKLKSMVKLRQVYIPINNLVLEGISKLPVGQVIFYPNGQILECINTANRKSEFFIQREGVLNCYYKEFSSAPTAAKYEVNAEYEKAIEIAEIEVEKSLDLLRCYSRFLFAGRSKPNISLQGAKQSGWRTIITSEGLNWNFTTHAIGTLWEYKIDEDKLNHLKNNCSFDILCSILSKDNESCTQIEKVIKRAIRWIGRGTLSTDNPERFLNFTIALEHLTVPDGKEGEIVEKLSRRSALLLAATMEKRIELYEKLKKLYSRRSAVAHVGDDTITYKEAEDMGIIATRALLDLTDYYFHYKWESHKDFKKWTDEVMFA
jgi:hypothetical protein